MEEEPSRRIRWDDEELNRLAADMAPRLLADPQLHPLQAVRLAQESLEPDRRRELKAWSLVEGRLQPRLDEALARLRASSPQPPAEDSLPPEDARPLGVTPSRLAGARAAGGAETRAPGDGGPAAQVRGREEAAAPADAARAFPRGLDLLGDSPAPQAPVSAGAAGKPRAEPGAAMASGLGATAHPTASAAVDPTRIEAALVAALQSSAVEEALVEVFARAMAQALLRVGSGDPRPGAAHPGRRPPARPVLLAGFAETQQQALREALGERFDVRAWKPTQGPQAFQALARLCRVVVLPDEADDGVETALKDMDVRVIRHAGNASRLAERIEELA